MAVLRPRVFPLHPLDRVAYLLQRQVPNGVDRHVHPPGMSRFDPVIKLLFGMDGNAVVGGFGPGAQGAVLEQFARAGPEQTQPVRRIAAHVQEAVKLPGVHQALLADPHRQSAAALHLPKQLHHVEGVHTGDDLQVVGVDAGDARGVQIPLAQPDQLPHVDVVRLGQHVHIEACGVFPQDAVRKIYQLQHLRRHGVQRADAL